MKRVVIAAVVGALAVLGLNIGAANAARIGPRLPAPYDKSIVCYPTSCTALQAVPAMRAPFADRITRFRVEGLQGRLWLQVLRRTGSGQTYEVVQQSRAKWASVREDKVASFNVYLRVQAGDWLALRIPRDRTQLSVASDPDAMMRGVDPGMMVVGDSATLNWDYPGWVMLFNVQTKH